MKGKTEYGYKHDNEARNLFLTFICTAAAALLFAFADMCFADVAHRVRERIEHGR